MKPVYERINLIITEFDKEDVIATSGDLPDSGDPSAKIMREKENRYGSYDSFNIRNSGGWF